MKLSLVTPDKAVYEGEVQRVQLPGSNGSFEVLENHAALISSLDKGNVKITSDSGVENFIIDGGVVEVNNNKVIVLAESLLEA